MYKVDDESLVSVIEILKFFGYNEEQIKTLDIRTIVFLINYYYSLK